MRCFLFALATFFASSRVNAQVAPRTTSSRAHDAEISKPKQDVLDFMPCSVRKGLFRPHHERFLPVDSEILSRRHQGDDRRDGQNVAHRRPPHPVGACFTARLPENLANNCIPDVALSLYSKFIAADAFRVSDYVDIHFQLESPCDSCELAIEVNCLSGDDVAEGRFKTVFTTLWVETVTVKPTFFNHAAALAIVQAEKESNETLTEEEKLEIKKDLIQTTVTKWPCTEEKVECDENGVPTHELPEELKDKIEYAEYVAEMMEQNKTLTPFHSVPEFVRNGMSSY